MPYVSAQIVLDGANNTFFGLIQGIDRRRRAHGNAGARRSGPTSSSPTTRSIKWFEPNGEPDADYETYKEYAVRDVAV